MINSSDIQNSTQKNYGALFIFLLYCKLYDNHLTDCEGSKRLKIHE
ncbi:hypothetical protein [Orientia tsutsugamushi]|nr:hypothetical protein [Orientia tsutsugamushi]